MSQLLCLSLDLPARITELDVAEFEMVFSELLNSAAVSYHRNGAGGWVIEALFCSRKLAEVVLDKVRGLAPAGQRR